MGKPEISKDERFSSRATIVTAVIAGISTVATAVISGLLSNSDSKIQPPDISDFWPWIWVAAGFLVVVAIVAVAVSAALSGARRRERQRNLVEQLIESVETDDLSKIKRRFTDDARLAYMATLNQFAQDLSDQGLLIARRAGADVISAKHVERASESIGTGQRSKRAQYIGSTGGILLGAGLSQAFQMVSEDKFSSVGVMLSFGAALFGVGLVVYEWARG